MVIGGIRVGISWDIPRKFEKTNHPKIILPGPGGLVCWEILDEVAEEIPREME